MDEALQRLKQQEDEVKELETQLFSRPEFNDNRKIEELRAENEKLNYRANILIRNIEELKKQQPQAISTGAKHDDNKDKKQPSQTKSNEKKQDDSKNNKQQSQTKSTEKKQDDSKTNKQQSQTKSSELNQNDNKNKKPTTTTTTTASNKTYFTSGAEGDSQHSYRVLDTLISLFEQAIRKAFPEDVTLPVLVVPGRQTDYQCNSAMPIAQKLTAAGKKIAPTEVAKIIVENLPKHEIFGNIQFSGPGFINVTIAAAFVSEQIRNILLKGILPPNVLNIVGNHGSQGEHKKPKVVIDFSAPNIAKEMHVGHLRSTIIGDSIARLLEYVGFDVLRLNHLGDWGTQFGMLIAHLRDKFPEYKTKSPPIGDLLSFYKESKKRFDNEPDFKQRAYECVVKLQAFDPDIIHAWKLTCDVSRQDFEYIYKELDIKIIDRGESFYQSRMIDVVKELESKNLLKLEEGRKVMYLPDIDVPLTVVKTDGSFTYDTSDMATIKQRLEEENGDWLIYVIDSGQALHMQSIFAGARVAGWTKGKNVRIDHVGFGVVLGEDGKKLKSRSGETIRLRDLLDEGLGRSMAKLKETDRQNVLTPEEIEKAQKSVAYACIKYADLSHNRNSDYIFSFDRMLDIRGNTAAYLLYAYTRIRSIGRTAGVDQATLKATAHDIELNFEIEERELKLAKCIIKYADIFTRVLDELLMHGLCEFMYQLATTFTDFYDRCYCVEKDKVTGEVRLNYRRILLCEATANVLKQCFEILGIQPLERM
ncbi:unnamed protein product [Rotaria sordida]|uniref:arginine--tRNA ligase n=1 Tax=Rotaria sordida TaxID=392033 RepID=A0A813Z3F0_9BILA|nr:unnamed protein product [Rotaria sordida]CAF0892752.1 unnamed protein product [Rotaria sordida]